MRIFQRFLVALRPVDGRPVALRHVGGRPELDKRRTQIQEFLVEDFTSIDEVGIDTFDIAIRKIIYI